MSCHEISGAYQHNDVNIGWYPYRAVRQTPVLTEPGAGRVVGTLAQGSGVGVQSVRNPHRTTHPPPRGAVNGYVWCYMRSKGKAGWVRLADIEPHADPGQPPLRGPAGLDFEVGRTHPTTKKPSGCGRLSRTRPRRQVKAADTYLRYSPRGTAFHYLHHGDVVRLLLVNGPQGFAFCEVVHAKYPGVVRPGLRGWVQAESLGPV